MRPNAYLRVRSNNNVGVNEQRMQVPFAAGAAHMSEAKVAESVGSAKSSGAV